MRSHILLSMLPTVTPFPSLLHPKRFSNILFLSVLNECHERDANDNSCYHGVVHPGIANVLEEEHAQVDDSNDSPEKSHNT